jgi:hypothetical protein
MDIVPKGMVLIVVSTTLGKTIPCKETFFSILFLKLFLLNVKTLLSDENEKERYQLLNVLLCEFDTR